MATRTRSHWKPRKNGQFDSRVGWKITTNGKRDQHKFRLGSDLLEAKRRDNLLRQIWQQIERTQPADPLWTQDTLELAKHVANGQTHLQIPRTSGEEVVPYAKRVHRLTKMFPMLIILPEQDYSAAFGVKLLSVLEDGYQRADESVESEAAERSNKFLQAMTGSAILPQDGPTLHQALEQYMTWLEKEYKQPEANITAWGHTKIKQVKSLISHHPDLSIAQMDLDQVESMIRYWRQRPPKKDTKQRVAKKSAENFITALKDFFKWLEKSKEFHWRKPEGFNDINTHVMLLADEKRIQVTPEQIFTLEELKLLYRYGTPLDRVLILLGLNCGFGRAESASLQLQNIFLKQSHSSRQREILNFESTDKDSFIKFIRPKTGVYGEFLLFQETVKGIEWALEARRHQGEASPSSRLLLNGKGEPFDKPTKSGNANQQIPNRFTRLKKRITDDKQTIAALPFKMLRKTGGNLVKQFSDGEIKGVYLCHGNAVPTDDLDDIYTSRPFGKVFHTLRKVEEYLQPVFESAGPFPFEPQPQAYTPLSVIDQIIQGDQRGLAVKQISKLVQLDPSTVHRHLKKHKDRTKGRN